MRVYLGADHAGFRLKEDLRKFLTGLGHEAVDLGNHRRRPDDDYPDFILPVARRVAADPRSRGIVLGGSGQGEAIAANKVPGVRAAVFYGGSARIVRLSREHNDANVLSLGARFLTRKAARAAVKLWLDTPFPGTSRHRRRIRKIREIEKRMGRG